MPQDDATHSNVLLTEPAQRRLRDRFFQWQCRIRQISVRQAEARPTTGMCPQVKLSADGASNGRMTTLIVKRDAETTTQLQHMVRKTQDPKERYDGALRYLAAAYYQQPDTFADEITALCGAQFPLAERLLQDESCVLEFEQYNQRFQLPCEVRETTEAEPLFQATYWHNSLFNANLPPGVRVLAFLPLWKKAIAEPGAA